MSEKSDDRLELPFIPGDITDRGLDVESDVIAIRRTRVMGLYDAAVAARLPYAEQTGDRLDGMPPHPTFAQHTDTYEVLEHLADSAPASGHDKALAAITVTCMVTAPRYWWHELATYHFVTACSSTSTMHTLRAELRRIAKAPEGERLELARRMFTPHTPRPAVETLLRVAMSVPPPELHELKAALPEGLWMTQHLSTNYRQLRTIRRQRRAHPLPEWRVLCRWIDGLPMADRLLRGSGQEPAD